MARGNKLILESSRAPIFSHINEWEKHPQKEVKNSRPVEMNFQRAEEICIVLKGSIPSVWNFQQRCLSTGMQVYNSWQNLMVFSLAMVILNILQISREFMQIGQ